MFSGLRPKSDNHKRAQGRAFVEDPGSHIDGISPTTTEAACASPKRQRQMDRMADETIRQFFSLETKGKAALGFSAFALPVLTMPPDTRADRLLFCMELSAVLDGLLLFFVQGLIHPGANDPLSVAQSICASVSILAQIYAIVMLVFTAVNFAVKPNSLTAVVKACENYGPPLMLTVMAANLSAVAFVISMYTNNSESAASLPLVLIALVFYGYVYLWVAHELAPINALGQIHQEWWYNSVFAFIHVISYYKMERRGLRERAGDQLEEFLEVSR